jgi:hypothetical protein
LDLAERRGYRAAMAEELRESADDDEDGPASTPFDNPFFLPVLLWVFAAWFGYDGWFNEDMEWIRFNRWGFAVSALLATYYTVRGIRERRAQERGARAPE